MVGKVSISWYFDPKYHKMLQKQCGAYQNSAFSKRKAHYRRSSRTKIGSYFFSRNSVKKAIIYLYKIEKKKRRINQSA